MKPSRCQSYALASMLLLAPLPAGAQDPGLMGLNPVNIEWMSGPIAFDTEPVAGAPYSAEAVTEVVQTLADGNRIVREQRVQISRDSRGRTRREQGPGMFGPAAGTMPALGGPNMPQEHVQISDPETRTTVMLDLDNKIAHRMPAPDFQLAAGGVAQIRAGIGGRVAIAMPADAPAGMPENRVEVRNRVEVMARPRPAGDPGMKPLTEDLGTQFIEGVSAEGTRTTVTIPAGQIGNELPISIVSERWFSPDLKVLVMSRQSDPRFGETTYRLTNLTRVEPPADLFEVPADFRIVQPNAQGDVLIERKILVK